MEKLSKGLLGYDVNRYCDAVQFPKHAVNGPIVLIVDENTSSGGLWVLWVLGGK